MGWKQPRELGEGALTGLASREVFFEEGGGNVVVGGWSKRGGTEYSDEEAGKGR